MTVLALYAGCSSGDGNPGRPGGDTTSPAPSATSAASRQKELTPTSRVRLDGIGPIVMRMTLAEATAAVGRTVAVDPESLINDDGTDTCGFAIVDGGPDGLAFMVNRESAGDEWRIVRLDVDDGGKLATGGGIRTGSTEADVRRVYGERIRTEPHPYTADQGGHYLILDVDGPEGSRLLFETDGTKVLTYRAGLESAVDAVEGCL